MQYQDELKIIKKARWRVITLLKCIGLFSIKKNVVLSQVLQLMVVVILSSLLFGCINFTYENRHNIIIVLKACSLVFAICTVLLKVLCYSFFRKEIIELDEILNNFVIENTKDDDLTRAMVKPLVFYSKKLLIQIVLCAYAVSLSMYLQPLMFMIRQYINNVKPKKYILPYPTRFPYEIEGGSVFWMLHWVAETLGGILFASVGAFTDNAFGFYVTNIVAQFRVLSYEIENLKFSDDNDDDNYKLQKYIVTKHLRLIKCCELLQTINGPIVLVLTVATAIILCCLTFQISQMETITAGQIAWIAIYIWYKLLQAFLFAWGGEEVIIASESLCDAVYKSKWECCTKKSIKHFIIMILFQKSIVLDACGITSISAQMFSKILNTTVSYFFLLQTVNQK